MRPPGAGMNLVRVIPDPDDWRIRRAKSAEADVRRMELALQEMLVLEAILADDAETVHALRVAAALVREHRNDRADEARTHRIAAQEEAHEIRAGERG